MIVLLAAMLKSGSAWLFNMVNDLLIEAGHEDGREIRTRFRLQGHLTEADCTVRHLRVYKLGLVAIPAALGRTFAIKSHGRPTLTAKALIELGWMRAVYLYRDPRDVSMSLYRHGKRIREEGGRSRTRFDTLETVGQAIDVAEYYVGIWQKWAKTRGALLIRYEDLRRDPHAELGRIGEHVGVEFSDNSIEKVVNRYHSSRRAGWPYSLHFDQAIIGSWKAEMSPEQAQRANDSFGEMLPKMGYQP